MPEHQQKTLFDIIREKTGKVSEPRPAPRVYTMEELTKMPTNLCLTKESLKQFLANAGEKPLGFDIETDGLWHGGCIVGASLAYDKTAIYVPFAHKVGPNAQDLTYAELIAFLGKHPLVTFHGQFEMRWTFSKTGEFLNIVGDGAILSKMLQERYLSLKDLAERELGKKPFRLEDLLGKDKFDFSVTDASDLRVLQYVTDDAINALEVEAVLVQHKTIQKTLGVYKLELAVMPILAEAEATGTFIDLTKVEKQIAIFKSRLDEREDKIFQAMGCSKFPLNSTKKLAERLFTAMGLKPSNRFRTKTGFSTSSGALQAIKDQHPVVAEILNWKHDFSVWNNSLLRINEWVHGDRVYTNFQPVGADATSRIYTKDANFTALPTELRECMACESGRTVVAYDFQSAELRIMAALANEPVLIDAFRKGVDPHKAVYALMAGIPVEQVTKEQRDIGKVLNYGTIYGGTAYTIARALKIGEEEADALRRKYLAAIPKVVEFIQRTKEECLKTTYTKTILGRRRRLPEVKSDDRFAVEHALRQAVNTACQSSCGDMLKIALCRVDRALKADWAKWHEVYMISPVFDSCAYSVPTPLVEDFKKILQEFAVVQLPIAGTTEKLEMGIDIKTGPNWGFEVTIPEEEAATE